MTSSADGKWTAYLIDADSGDKARIGSWSTNKKLQRRGFTTVDHETWQQSRFQLTLGNPFASKASSDIGLFEPAGQYDFPCKDKIESFMTPQGLMLNLASLGHMQLHHRHLLLQMPLPNVR